MTEQQIKILKAYSAAHTFSDLGRDACRAAIEEFAANAAEIARLRTAIRSQADQLAAVTEQRDRLAEATHSFRDAILCGRYQLEEPCLDNHQTNTVLSLFDDTIGEALSSLAEPHEREVIRQ